MSVWCSCHALTGALQNIAIWQAKGFKVKFEVGTGAKEGAGIMGYQKGRVKRPRKGLGA